LKSLLKELAAITWLKEWPGDRAFPTGYTDLEAKKVIRRNKRGKKRVHYIMTEQPDETKR
jgi:hypothetical protein